MSLKVIPLEVELVGWGDNVIKVTPMNMQRKVHEKNKISLSSCRHGNLYRSEEVLCVHEEVQEGLEIKSTDRGFAW